MNRQLKLQLLIPLWALLIGLPIVASAKEAPGALTFIVKDQITARPLSGVQITIKERETSSTQTLETDEQGRVVVDMLDPGLYSVNLSKAGYASLYEPSVRVVTRKNTKIEIELRRPASEVIEVIGVREQPTSSSSIYLNREDLRSAVGGGADPLLSLDGLPGLASDSEFASFSVRGRGPRDNLIFVDDFPFDKGVLWKNRQI